MDKQQIPENSKVKALYSIIKENPNATFCSQELANKFNQRYSKKIGLKQLSMILSRLFKKNKILRTKTQTNLGYVYSLKDQEKINKSYMDYLLPYHFSNKSEIIDLMLCNPFGNLRNNEEIPAIKNFDLFKKYSKDYMTQESIELFLTKLVAFVMGDGYINDKNNRVIFTFKEKKDAGLFKQEFKSIFPKENPIITKTEFCYRIEVNNKDLVELLKYLGAPIGKKVFQSFLIPNWIFYGPDKIKLAFLSTIYGNEGAKPQDNRWRIQFVLSKNKENIKNLLLFLNQIRTMLNYFGISSSFIQLRKQEGRQFCDRFYIKGKENLHKFYNLLEFSYASEKQRVLEDLIKRDKKPLKCNSAMIQVNTS